MRIAELSRRTGVPIPTIKYYTREGLVPPGERTGPNQARYDETHVRRLKLARALVEVGGLSIASAREVLTLMSGPGLSTLETLGKAQYALTPRKERTEDETWRRAAAEVDAIVSERGWQVRESNPARGTLIDALATLRRLGHDDFFEILGPYAEAAERLAADEVKLLMRRGDLEGVLEGLVVWTALGETVLASLRLLAEEAEATRVFGAF
ncbi:MerR family transcriptional regulator [Microbispora sp. RL4-1S]|uniref:MerR family transcriptional regulator n=1 Tax=Microbispora oryzae TaxID=2806554 RepID=A0A940WFH8_9ACTN|nr:MerR family transcriptional regulator [Microbispora oryzae]MBP2702232.1 MerR family transcriptional regulator [Microbispora oryzae]